jgi:hypothetical protein
MIPADVTEQPMPLTSAPFNVVVKWRLVPPYGV